MCPRSCKEPDLVPRPSDSRAMALACALHLHKCILKDSHKIQKVTFQFDYMIENLGELFCESGKRKAGLWSVAQWVGDAAVCCVEGRSRNGVAAFGRKGLGETGDSSNWLNSGGNGLVKRETLMAKMRSDNLGVKPWESDAFSPFPTSLPLCIK